MLRILRHAGCVMVSVTVICLTGVANADVLILQSRAAGLKRGDQLRDTQRLHVSVGGYVKILRPSGDIQDITGPYDRLVRDITRGDTFNETMWNTISEKIAKESAGTRGGSTGATRGLKP